ncbi:uncharacterized protein LOC142320367 isoform X1 [Lycorma delicatula]|uniref:uncharacterized protein LOC142320367 isoform X1 n=1 Tax=Lycorma delicatula TaxID=130591 RepID=UPI003F5111EE
MEAVTVNKGTVKGSTKNFITCGGCINNFVNDGIIKEKSSESKCAYGGDILIENIVENISSENKLPLQNEKKLVCENYNDRFSSKCYLKTHINSHTKEKNNNSNFVKSLLFMVMIQKRTLLHIMKRKIMLVIFIRSLLIKVLL